MMAAIRLSSAAEIIEKESKPAGEDFSQKQLFFQCKKGNEIQLPVRTVYNSTISNTDKTIWAVNFHETSNYNDVDLAICNGESPIIIDALFGRIEPMLVEQKVLPKYLWDNQTLEAKKITGNVLECHFHGASHAKQSVIDKNYKISVSLSSGKVQFRLEK